TTTSSPRRGMIGHSTVDERDDRLAYAVTTRRTMGEREAEPSRSGASLRDQLSGGCLRQQHETPVRAEVEVAQLGMPVEPESAPYERVEMLREEVGEIEGPELLV